MATVLRNHGYFRGVGHTRLHYRGWEASGSRAAVLVVHGLSDHSGRYEEFADTVADWRVSTFALDLRGHGHSDGQRGHVSRFDAYLQDVERFRREVQGLVPPGQPMYILGQSLGGLITLRYLEEYDPPLRGGVLVSPWLGTAVAVPRWKIMLAHVLDRLLPALPFAANIPAADLSHDAEVVARYRNDPLVHDRITPRLFTETSKAMGLAVQRSDRLRVPLLFLLAGSDRIVRPQRAVALARSIKSTDVTVRIYPDQYHELLNDADRVLVLNELREWLTARLA